MKTKTLKHFEVKGFKKTFNSIEAFKEFVSLGGKADYNDVQEFYKRQYPFNVQIEFLSIKEIDINNFEKGEKHLIL